MLTQKIYFKLAHCAHRHERTALPEVVIYGEDGSIWLLFPFNLFGFPTKDMERIQAIFSSPMQEAP